MGIKLIGRPRKYDTVEELREKIQYYFDSITMDIVTDEENNAEESIVNTKFIKQPGVISMCLFLGIDPDTLKEFEKRSEEYSGTIKQARNIILAAKLEMLPTMKNPRGMMFDLSANYGMHEKQQVEYTEKQTVVVGDIDD